MFRLSLLLCTLLSFVACKETPSSMPLEEKLVNDNPPMPGFDVENSDVKAIKIADEVMEAMGGRKAWDQTRYIAWNFFGLRDLLWDKYTGDVRISMNNDSTIYLVNINSDEGKVKQNNQTFTATDSIRKYLVRAKSIWINDSYWLVMPYKLKDSGVTLKYMGEDTIAGGINADVLALTFKEVGRTPQNKYHVYVNKTSKLVEQWDYFSNATDSIPRFSTPWTEYKPFGKILLSGERGNRDLTNIAVLDSVPQEAFTSLEPLEFRPN
ncbi:MAG: hypothetical protein MRY78_16175 [Saprospiraceae bacterium]|nr:hypothetical protein [Saprospiraceae bacterium]